MPFINDRLAENTVLSGGDAPQSTSAYASRFRFDPAQVMSLLRRRIVGQDAALAAIDDMLQIVRADIGADHRPLCVMLLTGPTGVGKTETVRLLAEAIHGSADRLCRIDMNTLAQSHYAAALTGAPPGYVGSKEGQTLFDVDAIQGSFSKPGIVLFDEVEKADAEVVRALMNIFDRGRLTLTSGSREVDFRNTLVFLTSNIGARDISLRQRRNQRGWRRYVLPQPDSEAVILDAALHRHFDPEFLNRIDATLTFSRLDDRWLEKLLAIELDKLSRRLRRRNVYIEFDDLLRSFLCRDHDDRFGARDVARRIRQDLEPVIARGILEQPGVTQFRAHFGGSEIVLEALGAGLDERH